MGILPVIRQGLMCALASFLFAASAQQPQPVRDINRTVDGTLANTVPFGGSWITTFCVQDFLCQPWSTDGTTEGTHVVTNIQPPNGLDPRTYRVAGGWAYFLSFGTTLWRTDGTAAGTTRVAAAPGSITKIETFGDRVALQTDTQIWISDGTDGGTFLLEANVSPFSLAVAGARIYFTRNSGRELWSSEGTPGGALLVKAVSGTSPRDVVSRSLPAGDKLLFATPSAASSSHLTLWVTDGTAAGTLAVADFESPRWAVMGGNAYIAESRAASTHLWRSDLTPAGTSELASWPLAQALDSLDLTATASRLYFSVRDSSGMWKLWQTDGSTVALVKDIGIIQDRVLVAGDSFYFRDINGEYWKTEGTESTTSKIPGQLPEMRPIAAVGTRILLHQGRRVWVTDGVTTSPLLVQPGQPSNSSMCGPGNALLGGSLYFIADDGLGGCELWRSDGSEAGTSMVGGARPADWMRAGGRLVSLNGFVYFIGQQQSGSSLWRSDGTAAGTQQIASGNFSLAEDAILGNDFFFAGPQSSGGSALWKSDGTPAGTVMIKDVAPVPGVTTLSSFVRAGDFLYFVVDRSGKHLYRTDGTPDGTILLGTFDGTPRLLASTGRLFAQVSGGVLASDGTLAGTRVISATGTAIGTVGDKVVVAQSAGSAQATLWLTDGSDAPWIEVGNLNTSVVPGSTVADTLYFRSTDNRRLFAIDPAATGVTELWTEAGGISLLGGDTSMLAYVPGNRLVRSSGVSAGTSPFAELPPPGTALYLDGLQRGRSIASGFFFWMPSVGGTEPFLVPFDRIPDPVAFPPQVDVLANSMVVSRAQLTGLSESVAITATDGEFCVAASAECRCEIASFDTVGLGNDGQYLCVRHRAASTPNSTVTTQLAIGEVLATFASTTRAANPATVAFLSGDYQVDEDGALTIVVERTGDSGGAVSVSWSTAPGSAAAGQDFVAASGTLAWADGDLSPKAISVGTAGADILLLDDAEYRPARAFSVSLGAPSGAVLGSTATAGITIVDNESLLTLGPDALGIRDTGGFGLVSVQRGGAIGRPASVNWTTAARSATPGTDFGTAGSPAEVTGTLAFAPGETTKTIRVGTPSSFNPPDVVVLPGGPEEDEDFDLLLVPGTVPLGNPSHARITILGSSAFSLTESATSVSEAQGAVTLIARRMGSTSGAASVNYYTVSGTAVGGVHYTPQFSSLNWSPGEATKPIVISILNDSLVNGSRTFSVVLGSSSGGVVMAPSSTLVTIVDDDNTVQFATPTATVSEGTPSVALSVTRTGIAAGPVSVTWTIADGTATAGADFGGPTSGTLTWPADDTTPRQIVVPILDDSTPESSETFTVSLSNAVNAKLGSNSTTAVTITDTDSAVAFSQADYAVSEGMSSVTLLIQRSGPTTGVASVQWVTSNGSATVGRDFGTRGSATQSRGTITWPAGDSTSRSISIPILPDSMSEGPETFTVALFGASAGLDLGTPATATVTINDDEPALQSRISFANAKLVVLEPEGAAILTLRRQPAGDGFSSPVAVTYATRAGTALATSDFLTRTGTISWSATDGTDKVISIPLVNNTIAEGPESFFVTLATTSPGAKVETPEATVTIIDDDEQFPPFGAVPDEWTVPAGATAGWHASNDPGSYEGAFSLRSDSIDDGQAAQLEVTRNFAAGNITFRLRVSSEAGFDKLRFFVDGIEKGSWSGTTPSGWQPFGMPITPGSHTLRWSYEKDASMSVGQDAAWIDAVVLP